MILLLKALNNKALHVFWTCRAKRLNMSVSNLGSVLERRYFYLTDLAE
jgi:hypothetical protein